jgi:GT2 family glycosyltransferase
MGAESYLEAGEGIALGEPGATLSIIIVNRNTRSLLAACLQSVRDDSPAGIEIIVVDNGSTDGSVEMIESDFPEVILLRNTENRGFAEANNQALRIARGRYLMLLNSDTEVRPGALSRLTQVFEEDGSVGAVGPALRFPGGQRQRSAFSMKTPWSLFCDMLGLGRLFPTSPMFANQHDRLDYGRPTEVDWLIAAAFIIRREVMAVVGLLDEQFRIHCNDADWCYRIRKAGFSIRYEPGAEVLHHSSVTIRAERSPRLEKEMMENLFAYYRKHYGLVGLAWARFWMVIGYGTRSALSYFRKSSGDRAPGWNAGSFGRLAWLALVGGRQGN